MKYARLLAISGILAACLLGCSVRRSGSTSDSRRTEVQNELVRLRELSGEKVSAATSLTERWRNLRIVRRDYDLDRPRNERGEYPVKSETILEGEEHQKEGKKEGKSEKTDKKESETVKSRLDGAVRSGSTSDTDVKAGGQPLWWWLAGVLMAMAGLIYLWWKYGKKNQTK